MKRLWIGAGAVLAAAILLGAFTAPGFFGSFASDRPPSFGGAIKPFEAAQNPAPAPELRFTDAEGRELTLADFKGRVVLLNLWATWCVPCVEEMPSLDRLQARLGGPDFEVVAISVDRQGAAVVAPFYERLGLKRLGIYLDRSSQSMRALGLRGLPTSLVIDRDGRIAGRLEGAAAWDSPAAEALIRHYLALGPAAASIIR
jgi:thiol-disulfide isomerase/thioredoxin